MLKTILTKRRPQTVIDSDAVRRAIAASQVGQESYIDPRDIVLSPTDQAMEDGRITPVRELLLSNRKKKPSLSSCCCFFSKGKQPIDDELMRSYEAPQPRFK